MLIVEQYLKTGRNRKCNFSLTKSDTFFVTKSDTFFCTKNTWFQLFCSFGSINIHLSISSRNFFSHRKTTIFFRKFELFYDSFYWDVSWSSINCVVPTFNSKTCQKNSSKYQRKVSRISKTKKVWWPWQVGATARADPPSIYRTARTIAFGVKHSLNVSAPCTLTCT